MKVTTEIKKTDLILFNLGVFPKLESTYKSMLVLGGLIFVIIFIIKGFPQTTNDWMAIIIASIGGGIGGIIFGLIFSLISILFLSSEKDGTLGKHEYQVTTEGLHEKTSANEGINKWEGIMKIRTTNSYILFQISSCLFHVVPKRSFTSKESYEQFINFSKKQWAVAHNK